MKHREEPGPEARPPDNGPEVDGEEDAELAEEMLDAEAAPDERERAEETLEAVDTEEDAVEALAEAEAAGNPRPDQPDLDEAVETGDLEPDLDEVLRFRIEGELDAEPLHPGAHLDVGIPPGPAPHEFVCRACHLVKRRTQLVDPTDMRCRDCVNNMRAAV